VQNRLKRHATLRAVCGSGRRARQLPRRPDRALPEPARAPGRRREAENAERVLTQDELIALERANLERALAQAGGKVSGPEGAAALLGVPHSTFNSRPRSLGVARR
jgi:transcriptional regulator with GAF, ATPase, and Fis domain